MEGVGAQREVSLLPMPEVHNEQETRLHEQEDSYGWTYGRLNKNFEFESIFSSCDWNFQHFEFPNFSSRSWKPQWPQLHPPNNLPALPNRLCSISPRGRRGGVHSADGRQVYIFIYILVLTISILHDFDWLSWNLARRKIKAMLDLDTFTTKAAVLAQLSEQSRGGIFIAHGVHKKVQTLSKF